MAFNFSYNFPTSANTGEADWIFTSPGNVLGLAQGINRRWNFRTGDTASVGMGPTSGQQGGNDGYIYIEMSSPGANGDVFTAELNQNLDASANDITVNFFTNQRGNDNNTVCALQVNENNAGWITVASFGGTTDPNKVVTGGTDIWASRSINLSTVVNSTNTRIRFQLTVGTTGTFWHNDYALDRISFVGTDKVLSQTHQLII